MAVVLRTDRNQQFKDGVLVGEQIVEVDVTTDAVLFDLAVKARSAIDANTAFLASKPTEAQIVAHIKALTKQNTALIRLLGHHIRGLEDFMLDNVGT